MHLRGKCWILVPVTTALKSYFKPLACLFIAILKKLLPKTKSISRDYWSNVHKWTSSWWQHAHCSERSRANPSTKHQQFWIILHFPGLPDFHCGFGELMSWTGPPQLADTRPNNFLRSRRTASTLEDFRFLLMIPFFLGCLFTVNLELEWSTN